MCLLVSSTWVIDVDPFVPNMIWEFLADLTDAVKREGGCAVYVSGTMFELSPSLINTTYCIPVPYDVNSENIDKVVSFITYRQHTRWEGMSSKFLTATNKVLNKLCCSNWTSTTNYTNMNQERLKILYVIHQKKLFDFGVLVYDQLMTMANNVDDTQ